MAAGIDIKIEGQEKLRRLANNFARVNVKPFAENAILAGALRIERAIRNVTPVDTGFLKSSVRTEKIEGGAKIAEHSIKRSGSGYGFYVHEGTWKMKARPFFKWGLEDERATLENIAKRAGIKIEAELVKGI